MGLEYVGPIDSTDPVGRKVAGIGNRDAVLNRLKALVDGSSKPIVAWGYDPGVQKGHLDREMLDQVSQDVPIWVLAYASYRLREFCDDRAYRCERRDGVTWSGAIC